MPDQVSSLRKSLEYQVKLAAETALRDGGDVPTERMEALRRLQGLIEIAEANHSAGAGKWLPAAALFASLAAASVLLFIHLSAAEIELDTAVSGLSFAMESNAPLLPGTKVSEIRMSGPQTVEFPDVSPDGGRRPISPAATNRIKLAVENASVGNITLSSFQLPKATRVRLETAGAPNQYHVALQAPPGASMTIQLSCLGNIGLVLRGGANPKLNYQFKVPQAFVSQSAPGQEVSLDLTFPAGIEIVLNPQLAVSQLSFRRVEPNLNQAGARYVSTIVSGALFNESLNGLKRNLRSGDALRFSASKGEMRRVSFHGDSIRAQFQGSVRGMRVGVESAPVDLMPSVLEWLRARHGLYLMWGSSLYLFGLLSGVWRWFRGAR